MQKDDDWTKLEKLITEALGADAIKSPSPIAGVFGSLLGGVSGSSAAASSSSVGGSTSSTAPVQGEGLIDRLTRAWNGDPTQNEITQQTFLTRFVHEFKLQKEALQAQSQINKIVFAVNSFLGEGQTSAT